jgi:hypothetical protein
MSDRRTTAFNNQTFIKVQKQINCLTVYYSVNRPSNNKSVQIQYFDKTVMKPMLRLRSLLLLLPELEFDSLLCSYDTRVKVIQTIRVNEV